MSGALPVERADHPRDQCKTDSSAGTVLPPAFLRSAREAARWRQALLSLAFGWVALGGLFWETALSMGAVWAQSVTYNHGFLIVPLSVFLAWRRRESLQALEPVPMPWGILLVGLVSFGWLLGRLASAQLVEHAALVAMMALLVWIVLGTPITWRLRMPLALLIFAVPFGESLVGPLQDYTAAFTVKALELSGVPVYWEGRVLTIPSGTWQVVESCSGIRYLLASMVFGMVYADMTYRSWPRRILFVLCSAGVPILANGVRAYSIVMIGHLSNNRLAVGVDHLIYGWVFFGLVMGVMGWVGEYWREDMHDGSSAAPPTETLPAPLTHADAKSWAVTAGYVLAALAIAGAGPVWETISSQAPIPAAGVRVERALIDAVSLPWHQEEGLAADTWRTHSKNAEEEFQRAFTQGATVVRMYVAWYPNQRDQAEAVNSQNVVLDNDRWQWVGEAQRSVLVDGTPLTVQEILLRTPSGPHVLWTWYWVDGTYTDNPYYAKVLQVLTQLRGRSSQGAVIALVSAYRSNPDEARVTAQQFLGATALGGIFRAATQR